MAFAVGRIVDHYRLDRVIEQGTVTVVYGAFDLRLQRPVAFKVLGERAAGDAAFRERFARESTTAAQLGEHPHIITVYDSNAVDDSLYFVTQFIEGDTLRAIIGGRPLDAAVSLNFLDQVASALDYAHRHGAAHRDVSPVNIMITTTVHPATAYLIDFGITKRLDAQPDVTLGMFSVSAGYSSAARVGESAEIGRRVDVHSLACTAFEALTGQPPFRSEADAARIATEAGAQVPSATALHAGLPSAVDEVFARAFTAEPIGDGTCGAFVRALKGAFPTASLVDPGPTPHPPRVPEAGTNLPIAARAGRRHSNMAAGAAALLVLVAVLGWLILRNADGSEDAAAISVASGPASSAVATTTSAPSTPLPATSVPAVTSTPSSISPSTTTRGVFGETVGRPVTNPTSPAGRLALALHARQSPGALVGADTPAWFYAEWLRLMGDKPITPVTASADGYVIDAGVPADLTSFQFDDGVGDGDGGGDKVSTLVECALRCQDLADGIQISPDCAPGPGCAAFASNDGRLIAVLRATVNLRAPATTLMFSVSTTQPIVAVSDASGTVRYDADERYFSITLPAGPPAGTESVVTVTFLDRSTSKLTVTYGE